MSRFFAALRTALLYALILPGLAWAGGFARVDGHGLARQDGCFVVNAPWKVAAPEGKLRDALLHGVKLHFVQTFELNKPKDWWFTKNIASHSRQMLLSYNALVDAWRIEVYESGGPECGGGAEASVRHFRSLEEALANIASLRGWRVMRQETARPGERYEAALRVHLDIGRLPQTLQLSALTNDRWELDSGWQRWEWTPQP